MKRKKKICYSKVKNNKGITLIALVITIIVLLILAGVTINTLTGENGIITNAQKASLSNKYSGYNEEVQSQIDDDIYCAGEKMKKYITSMDEKDLKNFVIINGQLVFCGSGNLERTVAEELGIDTSLATRNDSIDEIKVILEFLKSIKSSNIRIPRNDTESTPDELIGQRLYDKNPQNGENWIIAIDYNNNNEENSRYGSGYYYLGKGTTIEGTTLSNDYAINYNTNKLVALTQKHKLWSVNSTLAVTDGIALNLDPTSFQTDDAWKYVTKHGDVSYNSDKKSLYFDGDEDYLELKKAGLSFEDGFTFEIYANLDRLGYDNGSGYTAFGLFCRMNDLKQSHYTYSMRFGHFMENTDAAGMICKFYSESSWSGTGSEMITDLYGGVRSLKGLGYESNKDFYLTFVYRRAKETGETNDKVEYYVNGELMGYTYYGNDSFEKGREKWDNDECSFFVGCCPWKASRNIYYLQGNVYSVRLYQKPLTESEVKANMDATMQYRASF